MNQCHKTLFKKYLIFYLYDATIPIEMEWPGLVNGK